MPLWEYKLITSGKGGFARPDLMEKFLNDLGREEWEIVQFHTHPDNFLAFTGLARRSTQRDWTLEDAAAAAAKVEADRLRAEFEAKFKAATASPGGAAAPGAEDAGPSFLEEKAAPEGGLRKLVDTSRDDDPDAAEEEKADDWDKLVAEDDELPTFFEAIRPHLRRNQRGPGMSVGVDYLAKKWDLAEEDLKTALGECGFVLPEDEDAAPVYLEYDGDLYWVNVNRRGELWINTKEKPRAVFRAVKGQRVEGEAPRAPVGGETGAAPAAEAAPAEPPPPPEPLPEGAALLEKIRPHMRRNRRGPGGSGSASFLSRALRTTEADLRTAFAGLGLTLPAAAADAPVHTEIAGQLWWLNLDSRGGLWINVRDPRETESRPEPAPAAGDAPAAPAPEAAVPPPAAADPVVPAPAAEAPAAPEAAGSAPADAAAEDAPAAGAETTEGTAPRLTRGRRPRRPRKAG